MKEALYAFLAIIQPTAAPITLPMAAAEPMSAYMICILHPSELTSQIPPEQAAREALVVEILDGCAGVREQAFAATDRVLLGEDDYPDADVRTATIEYIFSEWERLLHFQIVERERFLEMSDRYEECLYGDAAQTCSR